MGAGAAIGQAMAIAGAQQGGSFLTNWQNNRNMRKMQKEALAFEDKQQAEKMKYDWEMIQYQNEYNSPVNQMKRLTEAGLNPNMMYGSGVNAASTGNQTQVSEMPMRKYPTMPIPQLQMVDFMPILSAFTQMTKTAAEVDLLEKEGRLKEQLIVNEALRPTIVQSDLALNNQKLKDLIQEYDFRGFSLDKEKKLLPYQLEGYALDLQSKEYNNKKILFDIQKNLPLQYDKLQTELGILNLEKLINERLNPYNANAKDNGLMKIWISLIENLRKPKTTPDLEGQNRYQRTLNWPKK